MGSGGQINQFDEKKQRENVLKNAKSLGNSLGTANKKSINMSSHVDKMMMGQHAIDQNQSSLNDGNFYTLAKTGVLNLNLSQLIKSQNLLEDDGLEDLHFYFVSFNNHKQKLLSIQDDKHKSKKDKKSTSKRKDHKPDNI